MERRSFFASAVASIAGVFACLLGKHTKAVDTGNPLSMGPEATNEFLKGCTLVKNFYNINPDVPAEIHFRGLIMKTEGEWMRFFREGEKEVFDKMYCGPDIPAQFVMVSGQRQSIDLLQEKIHAIEHKLLNAYRKLDKAGISR